MQKTFTRDAETWLAYLTLSFYGFMLNILGPITPYIRDEFKISYSTAGFVFSAFAVGMLISGLFGERLQIRWGYLRTIWFSAFGMAAGCLVFLSGQTAVTAILGTFLMGALGTTIVSAVNSRITQKYQEQGAIALTEMNVVASFMSMIAPLLVGLLAQTLFGWRTALLIGLAGLAVLAAVYFRPAAFMKINRPVRNAAASPKTYQPWIYWLYWSILFIVVSVEFCFVYWGSDFMLSVGGLPRESAVLSLSLFLGAMLIGRVLGSRILRHFAAGVVLRSSIGIVILGFLFFWTALSPWLSILGLFIAGLGVANLYPSTISLALGSVADELSAQASARTVLASGSAILCLPLLLGALADGFSMKSAFLIVPVLLVLAISLNLTVTKHVKSEKARLLDIKK
jgi:fucose permease